MEQSGNILVEDDSGTNLFLLQRLLEDEGYSVIITDDPEEGLAIVDKQPDVKLVLLDIMMPRIDGFEFMNRLSSRFDLSELPVIMVTAKDDYDSQEKALNKGAVGYVTKPVDIDKIMGIIREHIT